MLFILHVAFGQAFITSVRAPKEDVFPVIISVAMLLIGPLCVERKVQPKCTIHQVSQHSSTKLAHQICPSALFLFTSRHNKAGI